MEVHWYIEIFQLLVEIYMYTVLRPLILQETDRSEANSTSGAASWGTWGVQFVVAVSGAAEER